MKRFGALFFAILAVASAVAQDEPATKIAESTFSAHFIRVKADWTTVPDAKQIETDLNGALEAAGVKRTHEMRADVLAKGPEILFAPELVGIYTLEHYQELFAWLKERKLVVEVESFPIPKTAPGGGFPSGPRHLASLSKDETFLELPPLPGERSQLFVVRRPELTWGLYSRVGSEDMVFARSLSIKEELRGRVNEKQPQIVDGMNFNFKLPSQCVAVMNAFPAKGETVYRQAAAKKGFVAIVVVIGADAESLRENPEAKVHVPDQVQTVVISHGPELRWSTAEDDTHAPAAHDASLTEIVRLQHAQATELARLLQQLFRSQAITILAEERTNALVLQGNRDHLEAAKAVIFALDQEQSDAKAKPLPSTSKRPMQRAALDADLQAATNEQRAAEQQAANLARRYQEFATSRPDHPNLRDMREDVRQAVAKAFAARQKVLSAELAQFESRMSRIKESLDMRAKIQDQIIDRRVQELIEGKPGPVVGELPPVSSPQINARNGPPKTDPAAEETREETWPARSGLSGSATLPLSSLREITMLRSDIADNTEEVRSIEEVLKVNPQNDMAGNLAKQLEGARRRLGALKEELDTLIRLQETELRHAEVEFGARAKELERMQLANRRTPGAVSQTQMEQLQFDAEAAQLRLMKAKTLLDFLLKARPPEKADEKPGP